METSMTNRRILNRGLDVLDGMIRKMEIGERIEIIDAATVLRLLQPFEEDGYRMQLPQPPLVSALEDALRTKNAKDFVRGSRQLARTLRTSIQLARDVGNVSDAPVSAGTQSEAETYASLTRLERKYASLP
jgi:hypothetical protein